ncbi:MAG: SWF/SNF helicase family protein, partial [Henriciella sp.]|nr:SWF/SNF helicase family protein [Henriciella sp.]
AHHREVIARLAEGLADYNPVVVTGETSSEDRIEAVDAFQTGEASVYIGNITASGTAVTLTRASELLFIEASYVPGDNAQAADRIYRIGQTRPCRVRFLSLASSVDEIVVGVIRNKVAMHKELFG